MKFQDDTKSEIDNNVQLTVESLDELKNDNLSQTIRFLIQNNAN
jgi:hypothetical protein